MPLVEKAAGGSVYLSAVDERLTVGDRVDVNAELAEYLVEDRGDFEIVDVQDVDYEEVDDSSDGVETKAEFDVTRFLDRNVDPIAEDIHAGDVDDRLDAIQDAAERVGVQDAVGERRAELEA